MKGRYLAAAGLALTSCATGPRVPPEPVVITKQVLVPTPIPCAALGKLGADPTYADTDEALRAAPDVFESTRLLLMGRLQRMKRLAEYGAAKTACVF